MLIINKCLKGGQKQIMDKGRRKKIRYIQKMPKIGQFSPRGKPGRPDEIELKIDEFETLKLADKLLYQAKEGGRNRVVLDTPMTSIRDVAAAKP